MAHYAFLDENNIVTDVIVGRDENDLVDGITSWEEYYASERGQVCKRTSYNTKENSHLLGGTPFRGNYAGVGCKYDAELDIFIPIKEYESWIFSPELASWVAPVEKPQDEKYYKWDENTISWIEDIEEYIEPID